MLRSKDVQYWFMTVRAVRDIKAPINPRDFSRINQSLDARVTRPAGVSEVATEAVFAQGAI